MKKLISIVFTVFACLHVAAQDASSYIIKTRHAQQTSATKSAKKTQGKEIRDLISDNFKFYSPCEWKEGMRFMVIPEEYDLIVNTFTDTETGKEESNINLRNKIMIYQGHDEGLDGHPRLHFLCKENHRKYYYPLNGISFQDFCYDKAGVPTLAYLGDVDIARTKLMGHKFFTKTTTYCIDTSYSSDDYEEVKVPKDEIVTVKAIAVGTRNFPVKIIVEDTKGNEFYQNVAISKTNCGLRDDEFVKDNARHLFSGSFEIQDDVIEVSKDYMAYQGAVVHTKDVTLMLTHGAGKDRNVRVPRQTTFTIDHLIPSGDNYVTLTLTEKESRRVYYKRVSFSHSDDVTGDTADSIEDYFGYIFAMGEGKARETSQAARAAIRQGYVILGMTQDEVQLAIGEPDRVSNESGHVTWTYVRSTGKLLVVNFNLAGRVSKYVVDPNGKQPKAAAPQRQVKRSSQAAWNTSASAPIK